MLAPSPSKVYRKMNVLQGNLVVSKILLDADADTMVINKEGHRAVTVALMAAHFEVGLLIGVESFKQAITIANFPAIFELIYLGLYPTYVASILI